MNFSTLTVETGRAHIARVILNRPEVRNAFNETLIAELTQAFEMLGQAPDVRVIILQGNGPSFCAGADLNWMRAMADNSREENLAGATRMAEMLHTVWRCPKPVIAMVHGDTYAGGMGLVATCDIVVASDNVHFCLSEAKVGLLPATIGPYVIRAMGEQASRRYFVTAERFGATEAHRIGFVHEIVAAEALERKVHEIASAIVANSPAAVRESKGLVKDVAGKPVEPPLIADTASRIADIRASDEGKEGIRAFLEKRKPSWVTVH
jgi:methylglutaconyl-CoA hydratase